MRARALAEEGEREGWVGEGSGIDKVRVSDCVISFHVIVRVYTGEWEGLRGTYAGIGIW